PADQGTDRPAYGVFEEPRCNSRWRGGPGSYRLGYDRPPRGRRAHHSRRTVHRGTRAVGWLLSDRCAQPGCRPRGRKENPVAHERLHRDTPGTRWLMSHQTLEQVFREASGRIVAALAARFRNLDLCEDAFGEACVRAATAWLHTGPPEDPRSWLYCVARRCAIDRLRQQRTQEKYTPLLLSEDAMEEPDSEEIPDERLRLIFVCC